MITSSLHFMQESMISTNKTSFISFIFFPQSHKKECKGHKAHQKLLRDKHCQDYSSWTLVILQWLMYVGWKLRMQMFKSHIWLSEKYWDYIILNLKGKRNSIYYMNKQAKPTKHEIGTQCTAYYPFFISDFLLEGVHLNLELFPSQLEKGGKNIQNQLT